MSEPTTIKTGDYVFAPDGHEYKVIAVGGANRNILHLERPVFRRYRAEDCRLSKVEKP